MNLLTQALVQKALTEREKKDFSCYQAEDVEMGFLQYWTLKESFIKAFIRSCKAVARHSFQPFVQS